MERIDRAESVLRALGFRQFRVRAHGELARIEFAPDEAFPRIRTRPQSTNRGRREASRIRHSHD